MSKEMEIFDNLENAEQVCPTCGATPDDESGLAIDPLYNGNYIETTILCGKCGWRSDVVARDKA